VPGHEHILIPACEARSFTLAAGDVVRVIAVEGPQAADLIAFNQHEHRESLSTWLTRHMSGSFSRADKVYSKLPAGRLMFTVQSDEDGLLWLSPGRCNRLKYEQLGMPDHANCQDLLAAAIEPYGMSAYDVPDVFNIFMRPRFREDGTYEFLPSPVEPGDDLRMRAEMDVVVAVTACPDETGAYNQYRVKPIGIEILRGG
jgi:uncharacterized protein YcgI (DUF1989 family)